MTITGRGTVVTGEVEQGVINIGDTVDIVGLGPTRSTVPRNGPRFLPKVPSTRR